jgi:hypothetical protein
MPQLQHGAGWGSGGRGGADAAGLAAELRGFKEARRPCQAQRAS